MAHDSQSTDYAYDGRPEMLTMRDVKRERIDWLWPGRLPAGKLVILAGDPGLGKSFLTMDIAARVSRGGDWPDQAVRDRDEKDPETQGFSDDGISADGPDAATLGDRLAMLKRTMGQHPPKAPAHAPHRYARDVVIFNAEDDAGDTIRPRLEDAGADLSRVHVVSRVAFPGGGVSDVIRLDRDSEAIRLACRRCADPRLVILDPITAYLGHVDANSNAEVRRLLARLTRIAEEEGVCILCVTHLNKNSQSKAVYRSIGSLAFTAAARLAWLVAKDPNDPAKRALAPIKSNISGHVPGLRFRIDEPTPGHPRVGYDISDKPVLIDDLEDPAPGAEPSGELDEAIAWLKETLGNGPVGAKEVVEQASGVGISRATLKRAKSALGVGSAKGEKPTDAWAWSLP